MERKRKGGEECVRVLTLMVEGGVPKRFFHNAPRLDKCPLDAAHLRGPNQERDQRIVAKYGDSRLQ